MADSQDVRLSHTRQASELEDVGMTKFERLREKLRSSARNSNAGASAHKHLPDSPIEETGPSIDPRLLRGAFEKPRPFVHPALGPLVDPVSPIGIGSASSWQDNDSGLGWLAGLEENEVGTKVEVTQADPSTPYQSASTFEEIGLADDLLRGIYSLKFLKPSKIQAASLPLILSADGTYRNLIAQGHNGSGKTACFVLGMLSRVDVSLPYTQAVCLAPTRELARQIVDVVASIGKFTRATTQLIVREYSDRRSRPRKSRTSSAHIIVGTPGKTMDGLRRRLLDFGRVRVLVLDEADEMVNTQGMGDQTVRIKRALPADTQSLLFSATYGDDVRELALRVAPNANHIWVRREQLALERVSQYFIDCGSNQERFDVLKEIYELLTLGQSIIFVNSRRKAQQLTDQLRDEGHTVSVLYGGEMKPARRDVVLDEFRRGTTRVLVTTNVLSRGVDVPAVTAVINYDLPVKLDETGADYETYLHRIGRTGRFGAKGVAINFVYDDASIGILGDLEKHYNRKIQRVEDVEELSEQIVDT